MSHLPTGMLSGVWGQSTCDPQAGGPKPPCLAACCHCQSWDRILWKLPPTLLPPLLMRIWLDVPPHHLEQKEGTGTCWLLLSLGQLSLGPSGDNPERSTTDSPSGNTFHNPRMAAIFSGSTRTVSYGGATVKELKE